MLLSNVRDRGAKDRPYELTTSDGDVVFRRTISSNRGYLPEIVRLVVSISNTIRKSYLKAISLTFWKLIAHN